MRLLSILVISAAAQNLPECTKGQDVMGVKATCQAYFKAQFPILTGRNQYAGKRCYGYEHTLKDMNGPCGATLEDACPARLNFGFDPEAESCADCYYIERLHPNGQLRHVWIRIVGISSTGGSNDKFLASGRARESLCDWDCPGYNFVVNYTRVECAPNLRPTKPPTRPPTTTRLPTTVALTTSRTTTSLTLPPTTVAPTLPPTTLAPTTTLPPTTVAPTTLPLSTTEALRSTDAADLCATLVGHPTIPDWDEDCKNMCRFYFTDGRRHCPGATTAELLVQCVLERHTYCHAL